VNAKGQYGGGLVEKVAQGQYGPVRKQARVPHKCLVPFPLRLRYPLREKQDLIKNGLLIQLPPSNESWL